MDSDRGQADAGATGAGPRPVGAGPRALVGFALLSLAVLVVLALASLAVLGEASAFDGAMLRRLRALAGETGTAVALARDVTALGNDTTLWTVTLLAAGYLWAAGRRAALSHLLVAAALGGLLTTVLKVAVDRPRPGVVVHLVEVHSRSFPSGHAMNTTFVYATLAMIAASPATTPRARRYLMAAALLLALAVGSTRMVLGVHWPSDVLAGWAIGALWAAACAVLMRRKPIAI